MNRIALFTAFSPASGGGGTNLRSIMPDISREFDVVWLYTAGEAVKGHEEGWLGPPLVGSGHPLLDVVRTAALLAGAAVARLEELLSRLLAVRCDAYWVVSHNEGMRVAWELSRRSRRPVHLTIQDDWAGALCARSTRYRALAVLANRLSDRTIKVAKSVDVTSDGMRDYYRARVGVEGVVVHPVIHGELPSVAPPLGGGFMVGHVGSVYSAREFVAFAEALRMWAAGERQPAAIRLWGAHLKKADLPAHLQEIVTTGPALEERQVVAKLAECRFVYAMYPFRRSLRRFASTSLPTKLSTYVQAQRPILGHGPSSSTLDTFLRQTGTGVMWSDLSAESGAAAIAAAARLDLDRDVWRRAHTLYYGPSNVRSMLRALETLVT